MAIPTKLAHVVYMTRRFDEMLSWYQNVFEAKVQHKNPAFAFLNMSVLHPEGTETDSDSKIGVNHVGYTYSNVGELVETYSRLRGLDITPYWQVHHGVTLSLYYQDPDGNRMEFQVDCCANAVEAHVYMNSHSFAANPVGVEVDFDSLLAQYRKGVAPQTLLLQPEGPPAKIPMAHGL